MFLYEYLLMHAILHIIILNSTISFWLITYIFEYFLYLIGASNLMYISQKVNNLANKMTNKISRSKSEVIVSLIPDQDNIPFIIVICPYRNSLYKVTL